MDLERLNIEVRPRNHFQALDLGVLMAKRWYLHLFGLVALPIAVLTVGAFLLFPDWPLVTAIVLWWLKPALERLPLRYLSRAIFGERWTFRDAWRGWPQAVLPGLLGVLTYKRLSPRRSYDAPVWVLERLSGAANSARLKVLSGQASGAAFWLTIIGIHVEAFLATALLTSVWMFMPDQSTSEALSFFSQEQTWQRWLSVGLSGLCAAIIAPFYVAGGFSLYLNRRAELEAWDVEVGFRRLAGRLASVLVLALAASTLVISPEAVADERTAESKAEIRAVLDDETFRTVETISYPTFVLDWFDLEDDPEREFDLKALFAALAKIGEVLLWVGVAALLIWIAVKLKWLEWLPAAATRDRPNIPSQVLGLSLQDDTLDVGVAEAAMARWRDGDARSALSLLLQAALVRLIESDGCRFRSGDTEGDCMLEVQRCSAPATSATFAHLVALWRQVAYAHRAPSEAEFGELHEAWQATWPEATQP